jgi:hypothetical protein
MVLVAAGFVLASLSVACGGGNSGPPSPVVSPRATRVVARGGVPITDAATMRDGLLDAARKGSLGEEGGNPLDIAAYPAWAAKYPALALTGPALPADAYHVSVHRDVVRPGQPMGPGNPPVIAFAVADTAGGCAGGIISGYPTYNDYGRIEVASSVCAANGVVRVLRR